MISCSQVCNELMSRGYKVSKQNLNMSTDEKDKQIRGILFETGDINKYAVFNVDALLNNVSSVMQAANILEDSLKEDLLPVDFDYSPYLTKDALLKSAHIGLKSNLWGPHIQVNSKFPEILEYCYVTGVHKKDNISWSILIRDDIIKEAGLTQDELWEAAYKNTLTANDFVLKSVLSIMGKQWKDIINKSPVKVFYSVTSCVGVNGAVQVFNPKLKDLCLKHKTDSLLIYPQSQNNFMVAPDLPDVKETLISIAENDMNQMQLSSKLYKVQFDPDLVVVDEIPLNLF